MWGNTNPMLVGAVYMIVCLLTFLILDLVYLLFIVACTAWILWIQLSQAEAKVKELENEIGLLQNNKKPIKVEDLLQ